MNEIKQVIIEDEYNDRISKIKFSVRKICIEIWDPKKGLVYIWIKEKNDILKLKRFFESVEFKETE